MKLTKKVVNLTAHMTLSKCGEWVVSDIFAIRRCDLDNGALLTSPEALSLVTGHELTTTTPDIEPLLRAAALCRLQLHPTGWRYGDVSLFTSLAHPFSVAGINAELDGWLDNPPNLWCQPDVLVDNRVRYNVVDDPDNPHVIIAATSNYPLPQAMAISRAVAGGIKEL